MVAEALKTGRQRLRAAVLLVLALAVAWAAMQSAALALLRQGQAQLALLVRPGGPEIQHAQALASLREKKPVNEAALVGARKLLLGAPLNDELFSTLGLDALVDGDPKRATALMSEAFRRNPRSRPARAWLLEDHIRQGRYAEAIDQVDRLLLLRPDLQAPILKAMAVLAREPAARPGLKRITAPGHLWRPNFFWAMAAEKTDPDVMRELLGAGLNSRGLEQGAIIERYVQTGEYAKARDYWLSQVPESARKTAALIYDPDFRGLPGPAPFNWSIKQGPAGSAELGQGGGMTIDYLGSEPASMAEQSLVLQPGRYRVRVAGHILSGVTRPLLTWKLRCFGGGQEFASLDLPLAAGRPVSQTFVIPADGCRAQTLSLEGVPQEFVEIVRAEVTRVDIDKLR